MLLGYVCTENVNFTIVGRQRVCMVIMEEIAGGKSRYNASCCSRSAEVRLKVNVYCTYTKGNNGLF